jgi:hypothetical protein
MFRDMVAFFQKYFPCGTLGSYSFTAATSMPGITREIQRRYGRGVCDQSTENEAVAGLAEPRRRRILLPERGTAAVRRKCGRNVGPWVYTVGVRDVKMEIPDNML